MTAAPGIVAGLVRLADAAAALGARLLERRAPRSDALTSTSRCDFKPSGGPCPNPATVVVTLPASWPLPPADRPTCSACLPDWNDDVQASARSIAGASPRPIVRCEAEPDGEPCPNPAAVVVTLVPLARVPEPLEVPTCSTCLPNWLDEVQATARPIPAASKPAPSGARHPALAVATSETRGGIRRRQRRRERAGLEGPRKKPSGGV